MSSVESSARFGAQAQPTASRNYSVDTVAATELFKKRLRKNELDIIKITGEPGDVERDPEVACGDTALTFEDVSFSVGEKMILQPVSGHFEPGSLVAVMGPSGSGKTTLLDILAGKKSSPHGGRVHFNGRPRDKLFARLSSYVAQDDILPAYLTVQEAVKFHCFLKQERPEKLTKAMCQQRLENVLRDLGLLHVKDQYVGDKSIRGISGGQRRRVSLACAFAHFPQIMFCDEPTSGLSSTDAEACVKYMRLIARKYGITILVVVHQPREEVAKLFDELLLLTEGGRCVYNGSMAGLRAHCADVGCPVPQHMNPADHIMDKITPGTSKSREVEFCDYYAAQCKPRVDALVETHLYNEGKNSMQLLESQYAQWKDYGRLPPLRAVKYGVRFRQQLLIVGRRQLTVYLRDKQGIFADLVIAIGKGLILGLTYMDVGQKGAQGQLPFFFMLMMAVSIDGMVSMAKQISGRRLMKMETSEALYSEWAYIIPFSVISWVQAVTANTIFMLMIFGISSMPWGLFPYLWFWSTMLYLTMDSMYLMLSAIAKDTSTAIAMSGPFFILFMLFNGFTVGRNTAPKYLAWIVEISPVARAIEQTMMDAVNFYHDDPMYKAIADFFMYRAEPGNALTVMCGVQAIFRSVQVVSLKYLNNIQR